MWSKFMKIFHRISPPSLFDFSCSVAVLAIEPMFWRPIHNIHINFRSIRGKLPWKEREKQNWLLSSAMFELSSRACCPKYHVSSRAVPSPRSLVALHPRPLSPRPVSRQGYSHALSYSIFLSLLTSVDNKPILCIKKPIQIMVSR